MLDVFCIQQKSHDACSGWLGFHLQTAGLRQEVEASSEIY